MPEQPKKISFALQAAGDRLRHAKKTAAINNGHFELAKKELAGATEDHNLNRRLLTSGEAAAAGGEGADLARLRREPIKTRDNIDFMATMEGCKLVVEASVPQN